jgi:hypothetical protein
MYLLVWHYFIPCERSRGLFAMEPARVGSGAAVALGPAPDPDPESAGMTNSRQAAGNEPFMDSIIGIPQERME